MKSERTLSKEILSLLIFLTVIAVGVLLVVFSFSNGTISADLARILIVAVSTLSNVVLVSAYVVTLIQQRKHSQRDREREVQRDILADIVSASVQIIENNQGKILSPRSNKFLGNGAGRLELLTLEFTFEKIPYFVQSRERDWKGYYEYFQEEHPIAFQRMRYHDELLVELLKAEMALLEEIYSMGIDEQKLKEHEEHDEFSIKKSLIVAIREIRLRPSFIQDEFEEDIEDNFVHSLIEQELKDEFREYSELQGRYYDTADLAKDAVLDVELDIKQEYGISRRDYEVGETM
ncbi:hypothetical protein [Haloarchaeobius sp. DFWS5]|uniref:hypothetical protein n=1 Tax=Haloarchaeobius sp. DFWS5 TaxID=3446114 RepID=UPI003EBC68A0